MKAPAVDLKRLSTLRGTKTSFLTFKNYDEYPTLCQGIQTAPCSPHVGRVFLSVLCGRMEITVEPPLTATFLQRPPFFIPMDDNSYFNLSTMATSPQQQLPLKRVPSAKVASPQRPVNQQRTNGVYKTSFFYWTWSRNSIRTRRASLVCISVWLLSY